MAICLKTKEEIDRMRAAGRVVHRVLEHCRQLCRPGTTKRQLDEEALRLIKAAGAKGLFKNYPTYLPGEGFPSNLCISVNDEVVHGIAGDRQIEDGDIVGIDCGVELEGWCGDAATTVMVGQVKSGARRLCNVTQQVLDLAIENIRPGRQWSQIARLMQRFAERSGMSVVRNFVGHGIGRSMHEQPQVPNYVNNELLKHDILLKEGLVLAIEPMCNLGSHNVMTMSDGWTVKTVDSEPSAHYEHTVAVTADGADVLTNGD